MFEEAWGEQYPYSQGGLFPHPPLPSELTSQVNVLAHHMGQDSLQQVEINQSISLIGVCMAA